MSNHHKLPKSNSISHIDYHDDKQTLEIKFSSGVTYHYPQCDKAHYEGLKQAESAGKYFQQNVRGLRAIKLS